MSNQFEFDQGSSDKLVVFNQAARILLDRGFRLIDLDAKKPWGFYLSVDETQAAEFIDEFYKGVELKEVDKSLALRPKFLGIAPGKRLSWQYHHRRGEIWRTLAGSYQLITSLSDVEGPPETINEGQVITIAQGIRHRGAGLAGWALVAEIWQHTDPNNPSNENDIVRVQDDFGRPQ
jgi:mannose-6-phosphate isomerase